VGEAGEAAVEGWATAESVCHRAAVLTATGWPVCTVEARGWAAGDAGSGPGAGV